MQERRHIHIGIKLRPVQTKAGRADLDVGKIGRACVGKTFGQDTTLVHILRRRPDGGLDVTDAGPAPKVEVSDTVWNVIRDVLAPRIASLTD